MGVAGGSSDRAEVLLDLRGVAHQVRRPRHEVRARAHLSLVEGDLGTVGIGDALVDPRRVDRRAIAIARLGRAHLTLLRQLGLPVEESRVVLDLREVLLAVTPGPPVARQRLLRGDLVAERVELRGAVLVVLLQPRVDLLLLPLPVLLVGVAGVDGLAHTPVKLRIRDPVDVQPLTLGLVTGRFEMSFHSAFCAALSPRPRFLDVSVVGIAGVLLAGGVCDAGVGGAIGTPASAGAALATGPTGSVGAGSSVKCDSAFRMSSSLPPPGPPYALSGSPTSGSDATSSTSVALPSARPAGARSSASRSNASWPPP